jgi:glyoxylase I family protein
MYAGIKKLNHFAYRCRDAEETRAFYEDLLELPLAHVIREDRVPSTGEYSPFCHLFFEMADGSYVAFFDLGDGKKPDPSANTPAWVNHLALEVEKPKDLVRYKEKLERAGVSVLGVTDHKILNSIYFFDPNGLRVELTCWTVSKEYMALAARSAHSDLERWMKDKEGRSRTRP